MSVIVFVLNVCQFFSVSAPMFTGVWITTTVLVRTTTVLVRAVCRPIPIAVCVCVRVCLCTRVWVNTSLCACVCARVSLRVSVCTRVSVCPCASLRVSVRTRGVRLSVHVSACVSVCTRVCLYVCVCVRTCVTARVSLCVRACVCRGGAVEAEVVGTPGAGLGPRTEGVADVERPARASPRRTRFRGVGLALSPRSSGSGRRPASLALSSHRRPWLGRFFSSGPGAVGTCLGPTQYRAP